MKKYRLVIIILVTILFSTIPLANACTQESPGEAKTIKIGMITSVTGPMAPAFKPMVDAAKPTADLINKKGVNVGGQKYVVQILTEDDKSSPPDGVTAANKLVGEGVKFMVAPMFLAVNLAIGPICEQAKVIRVNPLGIDPTVYGPDNQYNFDSLASFYQFGPFYDYVQKTYPNAKKIAIISPDDPGFVFARGYWSKEIPKRGLQIVFDEVYAVTTSDFYPIVTKALAQQPDAIDCISSILPWAAGIINSAREQGFKGPIYAPAIFGDSNILNTMIKPEYAYDIFHGGPDVFSDKMSSEVKDLRALIEPTGSFVMDSALVMQATMPMLQGIEKAGSLDADKVKTAMEGLTNIKTVWAEGTWAGQDVGVLNHLVKPKTTMLTKFVNGKLEFEFLK
jgi:branched-chain amino acid transport system substrate-binding protein